MRTRSVFSILSILIGIFSFHASFAQPSFDAGTPVSSAITDTDFVLSASIDEAGTIFYVVVADGATAPTSVEVANGTGSGGSGELDDGSLAVSVDPFTADFPLTGLTAATNYDVYVVAQDDTSPTPILQTSPVLVEVTTCPAPPSAAATTAVFGTETATSLTLTSWTAPIGGADGYVVFINETNTFTDPADGDEPTPVTVYTSGQIPIYFGTSETANVTVTGLTAANTYFFQIYAYTDCSGTEIYETTGLNTQDDTGAAADVTAPVLTNAALAQTDAGELTITYQSDEMGTLLYVITTDATTPTTTNIENGDDGMGNPGTAASTESITTPGMDQTIVVGGLALTSTTYNVFFFAEDAATNQSNVASASVAADGTAPVLSNEALDQTDTDELTITYQSDEVGTLYYVVTTSSSTPTTADIVAGNDDSGTDTNVVASGTENVTVPGSDQTIVETGLSISSATYFVYFFQEDVIGNESLIASASEAVDATAPGITNEALAQTAADELTITYQSDEVGTLFYVITTGTNTPSSVQIEEENDDSGTATAVIASGNVAVTVTGSDQTIVETSLTVASTTYFVYFFVRDAIGNESTVITASQAIDAGPPNVVSINRLTPSSQLTNAASVIYRVTFNESVVGIDVNDFDLIDIGNSITGESITSVSTTSGTTVDVTVNAGSAGEGDLRLDFDADDGTGGGVDDTSGNTSDTDFTSGEVYTIDKVLPTITSATVLAGNAGIDITFSEPIYDVDGASALLTTALDAFNFNNPNSMGATAAEVANIVQATTDEDPLAGGETTVRVLLNITGVPDGDETLEIRPEDATAVYDAASNASLASATSGTLTLLAVSALDIPVITSIEPSADNSFFIITFNVAVDRRSSTSNVGAIRYKANAGDELDDQAFNDPDNTVTGVSISDGDLRSETDATQSSGIVWRLRNVSTSGGAPSGNETLEIYVAGNDEVFNSSTGDFFRGGTGNGFQFSLADEIADDFDDADASAFDRDGDGNIDEVEIVMTDAITDATVTPSDFTLGTSIGQTFDTGSSSDDNTFIITFNDYQGTGVATNSLSYTAGTMRDDAQVGVFNATQGNLIQSGAITPMDEADPIITEAITEDTEATPDGFIDQITVVFSEDVNAATIDAGGADFTLSDSYVITGAAQGAGNEVVLTLTEKGARDTFITPELTLLANAIEDDDSNAQGTNQVFETEDGAAPYATVTSITGTVTPFTTNDISPALGGDIDDPDATIFVTVDGNFLPATNNADGTWNLADGSFTASNLGIFDVALTTVDNSGNIGTDVSGSTELEITGGITITAPSFTGCLGDDFQTLGNITLSEQGNGDFNSSGTLVLTLPEGFEFNTAVTNIINRSGAPDISAASFTFLGSGSVRLTLTVSGTSSLDDLIIRNLEVRAVGSTTFAGVSLQRSSGTAVIYAEDTDYAVLESLTRPGSLASLDQTAPAVDNNVTSLITRSVNGYTLDATDQKGGAALVNWYIDDFSGAADFVGDVATQADLVSSDGAYTIFLTNESASCESEVLQFDLLLYDDDNPNEVGIQETFESQTLSSAADPLTFYLSNPSGFTVLVTGTAITVEDYGVNPIVVSFDPEVAGPNGANPRDHEVTYSVTNNSTGASLSVVETFTVEPEASVFVGGTDDTWCSDDNIATLTLESGGFTTTPLLRLNIFRFVSGVGYKFVSQVNGPVLAANSFQYSFDPSAFDADDEGATVLRFETIVQDGLSTRKDAEQLFVIYDTPKLNVTTISNGSAFCSDDDPIDINRSLQYISNVNLGDVDNPFLTSFVEDDVPITNGYDLYIQDNSSTDLIFNSQRWREIDLSSAIDANVFFPSDPDQDMNTMENEDGTYLIVYETEQVSSALCTATEFIEIEVFQQPDAPELDAATRAFGSSVNFVSSDEYLLEYCVGVSVFGESITASTATTAAITFYDDANGLSEIISFPANTGSPSISQLLSTAGVSARLNEQTVEFWFSQTLNGCESPLRKVTANVYGRPDVPMVTDLEASDEVGGSIWFDFCAVNGGMTTATSFEMADLLTGEQYEVTRQYITGATISATGSVSGGTLISNIGPNRSNSRDIPIQALANGDVYIYDIALVTDVSTVTATSDFEGCAGPTQRIVVVGYEEPTDVTALDFDENTLSYDVSEGEVLGNIRHSIVGGIDKYRWYTDNTLSIQIGADIDAGNALATADLINEASFSSALDGDDNNTTFNYYVTRVNNVIETLDFEGCETSNSTEISITVHDIQDAPQITSDNSSSLVNTLPFANLFMPGDQFQFRFSVCTDRLEAGNQLIAADDYVLPAGTTREYVWYESDDMQNRGDQLLITEDGIANFTELRLATLTPSSTIQRYFEVVQVTDIAAPYEGVESRSTFIQIDISPVESLVFNDDMGIEISDSYCRVDGTVIADIFADGSSILNNGGSNLGSLQTGIESYTASSYAAAGSPTVFVGSPTLAAGNPTLNLSALHDAVGTPPTVAAIGGESTVHIIGAFYQNSDNGCEVAAYKVVRINPDPAITFTIDGIDVGDPSFIGSYCYANENIIVQGRSSETNEALVGTFTSDETGGLSEVGGLTVFNPITEHNAFYGVTGTDGRFLSQSDFELTFDFTDDQGCSSSLSVDIFINPDPEPLPVTGLPALDEANGRENNIQILDYCDPSNMVTLEAAIVAPGLMDGSEETSYLGYIFDWSIEIDGNTTSVTINDDNTYSFIPTSSEFEVSLTVTDDASCTAASIEEQFELFSAPDLQIALDNDTDVVAFCSDDTDPLLTLLNNNVNLASPGSTVLATDVVNWSISSSNELTNTVIATSNGVSSLPLLDLQVLHESAGGNLYTNSSGTDQSIGGPSTTHVIEITYTDPDVTFQNVATACTSTISKTITINPSPEIYFTINDQDSRDFGTNTNDEFCYDEANASLQGFIVQADGTEVELNAGAFESAVLGNLPTSSGRAVLDPSAEHNAFHTATGTDGQFEPQSQIAINYEYTDEDTGCTGEFEANVLINPQPEPVLGDQNLFIQVISICQGEPVRLFVDQSFKVKPNTGGMTETVADFDYEWDVSTNTSGTVTIEQNNQYEFTVPDGTNGINVSVTIVDRNTGCSTATSTENLLIGQNPDPSFAWVGTTLGHPRGTSFSIDQENGSLALLDVDRVQVFLDGDLANPILDRDPDVITDFDFPVKFDFDFPTAGDFVVDVTITTKSNCVSTVSRTVTIRPNETGFTGDLPYIESFEGGFAGWHIEDRSADGKSDLAADSWALGAIPGFIDGTLFGDDNEAIDGTAALYSSGYSSGEISYIYSPSFDLSNFESPTISFLRVEQFDTDRDGVVFQQSFNDGRTWATVGDFNSAFGEFASTPGWYDNDGITAAPGTAAVPSDIATAQNPQGIGWALRKGWEVAKSPISVDQDSTEFVRFRFALAAQTTLKNDAWGFAFDRVEIFDRDQIVLVEQFSSVFSDQSRDAGDALALRPEFNSEDVLTINYITDLASNGNTDPINARNPGDPATRATYYGVDEVPGISIGGNRETIDASVVGTLTSEQNRLSARLNSERLNDPTFEITLNASLQNSDEILINADFRVLGAGQFDADDELALYAAVVEPSYEIAAGEETDIYQVGDIVPNVLRRLLPNSAGQYHIGQLATDDILSLENLTWKITNVSDPTNLRVIAFVQDINTKQVYQAASQDIVGGNQALGTEEIANTISIYPNPADAVVKVEFADALPEKAQWIVYDQSGRPVVNGKITAGTSLFEISTEDFVSGMYFLDVSSDSERLVSRRIIVMH